MKKSVYAAVIVLFGVNVSYAGETALDSLRASVSPSVLSGTVLPAVSKGYITGNEPYVEAPPKPVEWITINGGVFTMGTDSDEAGLEDSKPTHKVTIKTFEMSKTAVTVAQYAECVAKGVCDAPDTGAFCNWGKTGRQLHPINCVSWYQANKYAAFKGGRLPSESEWEYAATSGGRNQKYPWGNDEPTCDKAVMSDISGSGCGKHSTWPVCSKPAGNTLHGLCDMAGNVFQWVQDKYQDSYAGVPADGSAFEGAGSLRVLRGGALTYTGGVYLRADYRSSRSPNTHFAQFSTGGFRLARSR